MPLSYGKTLGKTYFIGLIFLKQICLLKNTKFCTNSFPQNMIENMSLGRHLLVFSGKTYFIGLPPDLFLSVLLSLSQKVIGPNLIIIHDDEFI